MKTHLSSFQVTLILTVLLISSSIIFLPALLFQESGNDAWITSIIIFLIILVYSPIYLSLLKRMGRKDIIEFSSQVLGKKVALLIGLVLTVYCILSAGIVCREITEIVITDYLPETPLWYFNLSILAVAILFVYYGVEVIARSIEVSIYLFLVILFIIIVLSINGWNFSNLIPILAEGYKPIIAGIPLGLLFLQRHLQYVREQYHYSGPDGTSTPGVYINGVYASEQILYDEEPPHQPQKTQTILSLADWTIINLYLDGEKFDILQGEVEDYQRVLNMKEGRLERSLIWTSPKGKKVKIQTTRLLSFTDQHIGVIKYSVTPLNFSGTIKIISEIEGNVRNYYHLRERKAVKVIDRDITRDNGYLIQKVNSTGISVGFSIKNQLENPDGTEEIDSYIEEEKVYQEFKIDGAVDKQIVLLKYASFYTSQDCKVFPSLTCKEEETMEKELKGKAITAVEKAAQKGYTELLLEQKEYFADYWDDVDVKIEGDLALQQAFRYNAFNLLQSTGKDGKSNAAAKGLTGEFYEGHYFWDTETYILPFFLYNKPEVARSLLMYRYNNLDKARLNARRVRVEGALFPWRTINGEEASSYYMGSTIQFHIDADIAYSIQQYVSVTQDYDFLYNYGAEILFETARMWASRGAYIEMMDNKYCINEVCGPDEYKPGVNNNCYTNYMAKFNLEFALETYKKMEKESASKLKQVIEKISLAEKEIESWQNAADNMFLPYNEKLTVHPQDDCFMMKDPIDIDTIPDEELPLVVNWHPLAIWRYQVIKQADVIMLMLLLGDKFTLEQKKANYDYYEPKTTHDSSLSPSMYSIIASEVGYIEDAYNYFTQTARLDLDDYNENAYKGVHLACMGSSWMVLAHGFAGMRNYNSKLHFNPYLPGKWDSYQFNIRFQNSKLKVKVNKDYVFYQLISGKDLNIVHNGEEVTIGSDGLRMKLKGINSN